MKEIITKKLSRPLSCLLEQGLFKPEQGEGQMWGQHSSKYAATVGTQLLAKIHLLSSKVEDIMSGLNACLLLVISQRSSGREGMWKRRGVLRVEDEVLMIFERGY